MINRTMRAWPLLAATILANGGSAFAQTAFSFDRDKAVAVGSKRGDLPLVAQDDSVNTGMCEMVELASPPLRVARVASRASTEGHAVDPAAVERAARPTLSVLYSRRPFRAEGGVRIVSRDFLKAPDASAPTPCVEDRRPERVVLVSKSGEILSPLAPIGVIESQWRTNPGSRTTYGATAEFDLDRALALGAKGLEVLIEYLEGNPSVYRFSAKQLKDLTPSWAR
jgi:hypothetical protein